MSLSVDLQYVFKISNRLRNFKQVRENYNFSCPICGDSKKNELLGRGWFLTSPEGIFYKCWNCNTPTPFSGIIKAVAPELSRQYYIDSLINKPIVREVSLPTLPKPKEIQSQTIELPSINNLPDDNIGKLYVKNRLIPKKYWDKIYYTDKFKHWCNTHKQVYSEKSLLIEHPRIILPLIDNDGVFGFSGRALHGETPKYLIIKFNESKEKIYGLDTVNTNEYMLIVEGQFDSMFLPNAVAVSGAGFTGEFCTKYKHNSTHIFDNEPRNKQILKLMEKSIKLGFNICIWPSNIKEKDINDMVLKGLTSDNILSIIEKNTYNGMQALLKFNQWKIS